MDAIRSYSITFLVDDLLVLVIIGPQEGDGLLHVEGVLESLVNLPLVVPLLRQYEGCRVGRVGARVARVEGAGSTRGCRVEQ